ncbi:hypothetical protein CQ050_13350 [Achromobacter sp. MYb9]|nr:hypothetical protein CQ050_13350 [Achromobacter sp. MYb9]
MVIISEMRTAREVMGQSLRPARRFVKYGRHALAGSVAEIRPSRHIEAVLMRYRAHKTDFGGYFRARWPYRGITMFDSWQSHLSECAGQPGIK